MGHHFDIICFYYHSHSYSKSYYITYPLSLFYVVAQVTDSQCAADVCQRYCQDMGIPYFRINVPLDKKVDMVIKDVEMCVEVLLKARQHLQDSPQLMELALCLDDLATSAQKVHNML